MELDNQGTTLRVTQIATQAICKAVRNDLSLPCLVIFQFVSQPGFDEQLPGHIQLAGFPAEGIDYARRKIRIHALLLKAWTADIPPISSALFELLN